MNNKVFSGIFKIKKIIRPTKTTPYNKFQEGDILICSIPAFGGYLASGKSYAVNVDINHNGVLYTVSGGRLLTQIRHFELEQI